MSVQGPEAVVSTVTNIRGP